MTNPDFAHPTFSAQHPQSAPGPIPIAGPPPTPPSDMNPFAPPPGELAGFWARFGAHLVDSILYGLVILPFAIIGGLLVVPQLDWMNGVTNFDWMNGVTNYGDQLGDVDVTGDVWLVVAGGALIVVGLILAVLLYLSALAVTGRTWGNRIVGIEVVNAAGRPIGWGPALLRTVVSCFGSSQLMCVGYLWMLGNPERQTWHDKIARTFVRRF